MGVNGGGLQLFRIPHLPANVSQLSMDILSFILLGKNNNEIFHSEKYLFTLWSFYNCTVQILLIYTSCSMLSFSLNFLCMFCFMWSCPRNHTTITAVLFDKYSINSLIVLLTVSIVCMVSGSKVHKLRDSDKPVISHPSNFEHTVHVGFDPHTGEFTVSIVSHWLGIFKLGKDMFDIIIFLYIMQNIWCGWYMQTRKTILCWHGVLLSYVL